MSPADATSRGPLRVLVVDDNEDAADSLGLLLRLWGHEARVAYDGAEALEAARAFRPDCLFLDIALPGMDGYQLARQLREEPALARAKLVALSAYSNDEHVARVKEAGFDHQLIKPADPSEVEGLLKMLSEVRALARETRDLIGEARDDLKEVRQEIKEVRQGIREVKEELHEVKDALGDASA
jgi:two-component system, OmpR family, response regulator